MIGPRELFFIGMVVLVLMAARRAQDQVAPDDLAMAFAGSPFSFRVGASGRMATASTSTAPAIGIANSRSVSRPRQPTLLVSDNPGRNRRGRLDHRPDPDHELARYHALAVRKQSALRPCDSSPDFFPELRTFP